MRNKIGQITFCMLLIGWFTFSVLISRESSENERKYYAIEKIIINETVGEGIGPNTFFSPKRRYGDCDHLRKPFGSGKSLFCHTNVQTCQ